jgi:hypothetical protein
VLDPPPVLEPPDDELLLEPAVVEDPLVVLPPVVPLPVLPVPVVPPEVALPPDEVCPPVPVPPDFPQPAVQTPTATQAARYRACRIRHLRQSRRTIGTPSDRSQVERGPMSFGSGGGFTDQMGQSRPTF